MENKKEKQRRPERVKDPLIRIPVDYPWKVLNWLVDDLQLYLTESDLSAIRAIVIKRDISSYMQLSEEWTTQCISSLSMSLASRRAKYSIASLLKKYRFFGDGDARKNVAREKFYDAEMSCRFFNYYGYKKVSWGRSEEMTCIYTYMMSFLKKLFGDVPNIRQMTLKSRHGPGATLSTKRGATSAYHKFADWPYQCTEAARATAILAIKDDERWLGALEDSYRSRYNIEKHKILNQEVFWERVIETVDGNRITFVPKNASTDRSIAIEPTLNVYLQLGIDGYLRKRLKRWQVDLDDQSRNQEFARLGSLNGSFSTIDLKSASDTVSKKLCQILLEPEWYRLLLRLASPVGEMDDGTIVEYEKISSMGNGFTFALESAIFAAAAFAVQRHKYGKINPDVICIYGDDIIVPTDMSNDLIRVLKQLGFTVNLEKTFLQGPFRESCGTDWFNGYDLRPVFLSESPKSVNDLFVHYNVLHRLFHRYFDEYSWNKLHAIKKWIPTDFICWGPLSNECFDSYLHCKSPPLSVNYQHGYWKFPVLLRKARRFQDCNEFLFRKIMHNLAQAPMLHKWEKQNLDSSGSRFDVVMRNATTLQRKYSIASYWRESYDGL